MTLEKMFRIVLIEDDPMVQEVNRQFVERVDGFQVVGVAGNGTEGLHMVQELKPDLVFLDVFMPSLDGIETIRKLRGEKLPVDVIVVTAAKDAQTVQAMLRAGAMDFIIKPFKYERIRETLERYRSYREAMREDRNWTQQELDLLLRTSQAEAGEGLSGPAAAGISLDLEALPKGLNAGTMRQILQYLQRQKRLLSAEEVADGVGIARVTARRYLDYLEKSKVVTLDIRYGGVGRPINRYALAGKQNDQK